MNKHLKAVKTYAKRVSVQDSVITLPLPKGMSVSVKVETGDLVRNKKVAKAGAVALTVGLAMLGL